VQRVDPNETIDLPAAGTTPTPGSFEEMIADCMSAVEVEVPPASGGSRSSSWATFATKPPSTSRSARSDDIERAFINPAAEMVASAEEREQVRAERGDQQQYSSEETMSKWGREHGANYMLGGVINSIEDQDKGELVVFYQVDLNLIDLERNTKVWQGQKKIKKYVSRSSYKP
jgi:hypothetical protein